MRGLEEEHETDSQLTGSKNKHRRKPGSSKKWAGKSHKQIKNQAAKCTHSHERENLVSKEKSMALDIRDPNQDSATMRGRHLQR
jgi:hypothetical protein